jgi:hypothetical protein
MCPTAGPTCQCEGAFLLDLSDRNGGCASSRRPCMVCIAVLSVTAVDAMMLATFPSIASTQADCAAIPAGPARTDC